MREARMAERATDATGIALAAPWGASLGAPDHVRVEREQRDGDGPRRPWQTGHLAAVESLSWDDLIAIGDARLRVGSAVGARPSGELAARRVYFAALYRACREESLEGILRAAEAFADLGDGDVVEECLGLAELKVDSEEARRRVSALVQRLGVAQAVRNGATSSSDRPNGAAAH
jgi:hypothetical protein